MNFTYLFIDICAVIVPLLFSFHPRLEFYRTWKTSFPAITLTALYFVAWDVYFTSLNVWGFNPRYLTGIRIGNLPLEEILFFFCIPYACLFTFHCLKNYFGKIVAKSFEGTITFSLIIILAILGILNYHRIYTVFTFSSLAALLIVTKYVLKVNWLGTFYAVYTILLFPFLIVNGVLTGAGLEEPVVWYSESEIMGMRILTIPLEDVFYGMELMLMNLLIYQYLQRKQGKIHKNESLSHA